MLISAVFVTVSTVFVAHTSEAARILGLFPYPLKSHFIIFDALLTELSKRGHDVTVVTAFPKRTHQTNYTEIDVSRCIVIPRERFSLQSSIDYYGTPLRLIRNLKFSVLLFDTLLECEPMRTLKSAQNRFDLVITEIFASDALLAYPYIYKTPFILFSTLPMLPWHSEHVANIENPSVIPFTFTDYSFDSKYPTFFERLYNVFVYVVCKSYYYFEWIPLTDDIVRKHFGKSIPSTSEIAKNTSLIFTYSHFSVNRPRPTVPAVVEVGGLNIREPKPLPQDIKRFLDESTDGVIYFCLGSLMEAATMREDVRNAFIRVFDRFPQRVLWKWENETIPRKSNKIMYKNWMPQRDILAHPKVKLFITHGGSLGLYEAVYEAVPVLCVPFYGDQIINSRNIKSNGGGEILRYDDITEETLLEKINNVLNDKRYAENMEKLSSIFKDRPFTPLDTAIYWTEYVIRRTDLSYLKSAAVHLPWYKYVLLDVIVSTSTILIVALYVTWKISSLFIRVAISFFAKKHKYKKN